MINDVNIDAFAIGMVDDEVPPPFKVPLFGPICAEFDFPRVTCEFSYPQVTMELALDCTC